MKSLTFFLFFILINFYADAQPRYEVKKIIFSRYDTTRQAWMPEDSSDLGGIFLEIKEGSFIMDDPDKTSYTLSAEAEEEITTEYHATIWFEAKDERNIQCGVVFKYDKIKFITSLEVFYPQADLCFIYILQSTKKKTIDCITLISTVRKYLI